MMNNIELCRKKLGISQMQLAHKIGVTRKTINRTERDKVSISLKVAMKLAKTLNATIEELFMIGNYNICFHCGQKFIPNRSDQMYCCKRCRLLEYKLQRKCKKKQRGNEYEQ